MDYPVQYVLRCVYHLFASIFCCPYYDCCTYVFILSFYVTSGIVLLHYECWRKNHQNLITLQPILPKSFELSNSQTALRIHSGITKVNCYFFKKVLDFWLILWYFWIRLEETNKKRGCSTVPNNSYRFWADGHL